MKYFRGGLKNQKFLFSIFSLIIPLVFQTIRLSQNQRRKRIKTKPTNKKPSVDKAIRSGGVYTVVEILSAKTIQ